MPDPRPETEPLRREAPGGAARPQPPARYGFPLLATYSQRVGGFLIDIGIPGGLLAVVLIGALLTRNVVVVGVVYPVAAAVGLAFLVWNSGYRQGRSGQSLGKSVLGTRLVSAGSGEPIGFARAFGRQVAHLLNGIPLGLGYLWPLWDEQRQTFADKVCSTLVVQADL
ncbi:RDD family protein [Pseudonocardia cypriaca]|uniref:Putative RDD family membrane protein YckC n=1 Tax=Pseudonocardia cypriaca TaxID=882449 RepID=A0A543FYI6_9PSEU|nr:RDD family protein [Pseudonocardia cypriaca]TQM38845.1 putative RDD family membrane protein YckC [Pseudonocardia cypriaca]